MKQLLKNINQAGVKFVCTGVLGLVIFSAAPAHAEDGVDLGSLIKKGLSAGEDSCERALNRINDEKRSLGEACSEAGLGSVKQCYEDSMECDDFITGDDIGSSSGGMDAILGAADTLSGMTISTAFKKSGASANGSCPQLSGQDYFERKKDLESELKDLQKDTADITTEIADAKKEYQDNITQIQKDIQTAQEDLKKLKLDKKNELAEQIAEASRSADQARNSLRESELRMVQLRADLNLAQADQTKVLITFSDQSMKASCMANVSKQNEEYKKMFSSKSVGSTNLISASKQKKATLINAYNSCIASYQQQRVDGFKQAEAKQKTLQQQIQNLQGSIDDQRVAMQSATDRITQIQTDNQTAINDAEQSVIQKMSMAQQEMQTASTSLQDKLTALSQKQQANQQAIARVNANIASLDVGGKPKQGTKTSVSEARGRISSYVESIKDLANAANSNGKSCPAAYDALASIDSTGARKTRKSTSGSSSGSKSATQ